VFEEDLGAFFNTAEHAVSATAGWGGTVNVIFDNAYLEQLGIAGTNPVALAQASDVSAARIGSTLTINGTVYTIRNRAPQDDGATVLLELQTG